MQSFLWRENVGVLIAKARRRIKQEVWRRIRPHRVTPQQALVLMTIYRKSDGSVGMLAQQTGMDPPTSCRIVSTLTKRKLISSDCDPEDRRRFRLRLTPSGNKLVQTLEPILEQLYQDIESDLTPPELSNLLVSLNRIISNMEKFSSVSEPDDALDTESTHPDLDVP